MGTCDVGGVAVVLALIVANPEAGGALIEANPEDEVAGGGRVSYICLGGGLGFVAGVTGD